MCIRDRYLLYVGWQLVWSKKSDAIYLEANNTYSTRAGGHKDVFVRGFWTNVLNPKVALFFLAFVPQFIAPEASNKALVFVFLGVIFNLNAVPINVGYAVLGGWAARRLSVVQRGMHSLERVAGVMFMGFGLKLALTDNPHP